MKTFRTGGIYLPENKLSANKRIEKIPLPSQVVIPLLQHVGTPAVAVVEKGAEVKVGTLLAKSEGRVSANIHSSVSGKVLEIQTLDTDARKCLAIDIAVEGDIWEDTIDRSEQLLRACNLAPEKIIEKIAEAGIVGMGGAVFPTHIKLTFSPELKADMLIINAAECEPFLTSDHQLMLTKGEEILVGTAILMRATRVKKAFVGIENNKKDAIAHLKELSTSYAGIEIVPLKVRYPQGSEKQLIEALTGRGVTSGSLPVSVGVVVQNVATVFAVYEAVQKNKPLIERVVTVTGKKLSNPCNVWVRIGTPVSELIAFAGGLPEDTGKIIEGGPMMGRAFADTAIPVTKGCSGILIMQDSESQRKEIRNCIRCSKCVNVCPVGLLPNFLMNVVEFSGWDKAKELGIVDCIECGLCSYVCPANRQLLDYIRLGKSKVKRIIKAKKS